MVAHKDVSLPPLMPIYSTLLVPGTRFFHEGVVSLDAVDTFVVLNGGGDS
jgi:hypothetical protein